MWRFCLLVCLVLHLHRGWIRLHEYKLGTRECVRSKDGIEHVPSWDPCRSLLLYCAGH